MQEYDPTTVRSMSKRRQDMLVQQQVFYNDLIDHWRKENEIEGRLEVPEELDEYLVGMSEEFFSLMEHTNNLLKAGWTKEAMIHNIEEHVDYMRYNKQNRSVHGLMCMYTNEILEDLEDTLWNI
jgi:ribosomal protein L39E